MAEQLNLQLAGEEAGTSTEKDLYLSCKIEIATTTFPASGGRVDNVRYKTVYELTQLHLSKYYTLVSQHVRDGCYACGPDQVLESYLKFRLERKKFKGRTSAGLCSLALKFERMGAKRELVNRFFILSGRPRSLLDRKELSLDEFFEGLQYVWEDFQVDPPKVEIAMQRNLASYIPSRRRSILVLLGRLKDQGTPMPGTRKEMLDLLQVAEVMLS